VDDKNTLASLLAAVQEISLQIPILFPVHPRTLQKLESYGLLHVFTRIALEEPRVDQGGVGIYGLPPIGYLDFLQLMASAKCVLTDSGGIQEETTILRVPCVTIRENTERPVTITHGTNRLAGIDPKAIVREAQEALTANYSSLQPPPYWDGKAGERIVKILYESYSP
jgi:UDP-N-acetylglucosamine 2-epimerase (non-hydrolysing)